MSSSNKEKAPHIIKLKKDEYHQLYCDWTFYYLIPNKINSQNKNWDSYLKKLHDFSTFEDFWAIVNSIEAPSELQKGCRYYIFKKNIQPLWEDQQNTGGREISIQYHFPRRSTPEFFNLLKGVHAKSHQKWIKLVTAVLSNSEEYFHEKESINGVEFTCRANAIKVGIWTKPIAEKQYESLRVDLLKLLEFNETENEEYKTEVITLEEEKEEMHQTNKKSES